MKKAKPSEAATSKGFWDGGRFPGVLSKLSIAYPVKIMYPSVVVQFEIDRIVLDQQRRVTALRGSSLKSKGNYPLTSSK